MTTRRIFPDSEFSDRLARSRAALERYSLALTFAFGSHNWFRDHAIRYLTGYDSPLESCLLVVPEQGSPTLVIQDRDDLERARAVSWVEDVVWTENLSSYIAARVAKETGPRKRLGIIGGECMGFSATDLLPRDIAEAIRNANPDLELIDVGREFESLRTIRSDLELEMIRKAGKIADIGAEAFFVTGRVGLSERDLWSEVWHAMQFAGAEDVHISIGCGPQRFWAHPPSDAVFKPGDIVSIEISPRVNGYFSQANRMFFVGDENREWRDIERLALGARDIAIEAMTHGSVVKDVVAKVAAFVHKSSLATMDVGGIHRIGHGCGLGLDEEPFLTGANTAVLQTNMTMACHPILYLPYRHSMLVLGDYLRIGESKAELLTRSQQSIPVV